METKSRSRGDLREQSERDDERRSRIKNQKSMRREKTPEMEKTKGKRKKK